ncbi:MAG: HPr family phosphocarrier protein [Treponema sp.]|jgi:phosphocarrier protein|nr:HPr family phosphocarrier protein [Treponema sp.]
MYAKKTVIINKSGLHARPGSFFVREAKKFSSDITITRLDGEDKPVKNCSAKSIALVMAMMLTKGTRIEISARGEDEQAAVDTLTGLVDTGLNDL